MSHILGVSNVPRYAAPSDTRNRTTSPIVTGTSVVALKYKDGVMMAADTLGSYGGLARFKDVKRIFSVGKKTLIGGSGDISDLQEIEKMLDDMVVADACIDDGNSLDAHSIHTYLGRIMYQKRSKMNPLWNSLVVAGLKADKTPFLGTVDHIGTQYESDHISTGFGLHLATPILRDLWRPNMTEPEAKALLLKCMEVLFYRDCRTINNIQVARITAAGSSIDAPVAIATKWDYKAFVDPKAGVETGGSW